ncbi:hypothetical protein Patl1_02970 [Pistacia atlantica]|uniref:Uncharacterized protein n=1 Tax=Pistacia atlantica TaxID=434234 RepID=A0ACC1C4K7_9ROSI|nr:hypothetical protein Patl1_02970 [Pistacia atlantica]
MLQTTNMYFNISGFIRSLASVALCETFVVNGMERFDAKKMLKAVEEFSVTTYKYDGCTISDGCPVQGMRWRHLWLGSRAVFRTVRKEESNRLGSAGRLSGGFEAKIVDTETGEALPLCKEGELWIKGPSTMKGYVGDEEATASTLLTGGWLRTGDLCYIDDDGFAFIVDRIKELIKYQAFQVPPAELENLLISHTDIADAAVIP